MIKENVKAKFVLIPQAKNVLSFIAYPDWTLNNTAVDAFYAPVSNK